MPSDEPSRSVRAGRGTSLRDRSTKRSSCSTGEPTWRLSRRTWQSRDSFIYESLNPASVAMEPQRLAAVGAAHVPVLRLHCVRGPLPMVGEDQERVLLSVGLLAMPS